MAILKRHPLLIISEILESRQTRIQRLGAIHLTDLMQACGSPIAIARLSVRYHRHSLPKPRSTLQ